MSRNTIRDSRNTGSTGSLESAQESDCNVVHLEPASTVQSHASTTKEWLNIKEAAAYLGRSRQTLYNWISSGNGPRRKKEYGRWYFLKKDLDAHRSHNTEIREAFR